jgi:hypothetical protein
MAALLWVAQLETYFILGDLNYLFTTDEQHPVTDPSHPPALSRVGATEKRPGHLAWLQVAAVWYHTAAGCPTLAKNAAVRQTKGTGHSPAPFRSCDVLCYHIPVNCGSCTLANNTPASACGLRLRLLGNTSRAEITTEVSLLYS